ncbi:MAG: hypothetical protein IN807_01400 [Cutibacterium sp.]|nr:hypothetical protein HMPREF9616_00759 [Cutibacterium acnes HL007PA1]MCA3766390.1 hypothetical protein [Cutibacterium sp.]
MRVNERRHCTEKMYREEPTDRPEHATTSSVRQVARTTSSLADRDNLPSPTRVKTGYSG